jgi:hypothetical protein
MHGDCTSAQQSHTSVGAAYEEKDDEVACGGGGGGGEAVVSRRPCKLARHCVSRSARLVCSIEINS